MSDDRLRGAPPGAVREAVESETPLSGASGFAGSVDDRLVRDVLGREPLFLDRSSTDWAFSPVDLGDPVALPGGTAIDRGAVSDHDPVEHAGGVLALPDPDPVDRETGVKRVETALSAVAEAVPDDCPVAFSGGVDSGVVAAMTDGPLYVVGFPESHDRETARQAAAAMDRELRVVELTHERLREAVPRVVTATGRTNPMDVSIAVPLLLAAERAAADGHDHLAVGQGADELFGGYAKVAKAPDDPRVEAGTVRGATREVVQSLPDQLARDVPLLRAAGVDPVAPFLDDRVVRAALELPGEALVESDRRKAALRGAARSFVPDAVAEREKKAVQYGTYVSRELDRLARQEGFKRRMDDHVGQYVESLQ